ncbi:MAG: hypothetical protein JWO41_338 [Candidatus Saccharibacteria bacterium]|nr:hypothetical protein [Candidatus Saccharibacteria bacterium]
MSDYATFRFKQYDFDPATGLLSFNYGYDEALNFTETYHFDFPFVDYDPQALDRALQLLFFIAGVSYYKMYLAPEIVVETGQIDTPLAAFLTKTYQKGLGEFFVVNQLDVQTPIDFPINTEALAPVATNSEGLLVGIGGGKDSLLSAELLKATTVITTWSLNHRSQLEPLISVLGTHHLWVGRTWDPQIASLNKQGALNGHVPISAIFSAVGSIVSILSGKRDAIVSNESSASEPTMEYQGQSINHQYSKSLEYEIDFQACLSRLFGSSLRYYSLLRPFSELHIAELFAQNGYEKYKTVFSSCNRAFTHDQNHMFWCGECAKCAFVFLILTPFIEQADLEQLWGGKNLLLDPTLQQTYKQLLGIEGDKPFDCVGEIKEARAAMRLAQQKYPELSRYNFDIPESYDFRAWSEHSMPPEIFTLLEQELR